MPTTDPNAENNTANDNLVPVSVVAKAGNISEDEVIAMIRAGLLGGKKVGELWFSTQTDLERMRRHAGNRVREQKETDDGNQKPQRSASAQAAAASVQKPKELVSKTDEPTATSSVVVKSALASDKQAPIEVVVTDIHMGFWSMVVFMIKWGLAAIPALIILVIIGFLLVGILGSMR